MTNDYRRLMMAMSLAACEVCAQCGGSLGGVGLILDSARAGTVANVFVNAATGSSYAVAFSSVYSPFVIPGVGTVCANPAAPGFSVLAVGTTVPGVPAFTATLPPFLAGLPLVGAIQAAVLSVPPAPPALTPAIGLNIAAPNSYTVVNSLSAARAFMPANLMDDGRVLIAGGGGGSVSAPSPLSQVDIFDPSLRTMAPGPSLAIPRAFHTGTRLDDGRILICGGVTAAPAAIASSCELFDPRTGVWSPAASMTVPRAAHAAIKLLNGDVLVVGGTSSAGTALATVLNASHNTAEIYSPATNTWTPVASTMSSRRFLPAIASLPNGDVLVVSGISGAVTIFGLQIPTWTVKCDRFVFGSLSFGAALNVPGAGVAGAGVGVLPSGRVWLAGGATIGSLSTSATAIYDDSVPSWSAGPSLSAAAALPNVARLHDGRLFLCGGIGGTLLTPSTITRTYVYDGTVLSSGVDMPAGVGASAITVQNDGLIFVGGGFDRSGAARQACFVAAR